MVSRRGKSLAAAGVVVLIGILGLWAVDTIQPNFGVYDSDRESVPLERINDRLRLWMSFQLPSSASDIHVVIMGGVDPTMLLRSRAREDEARQFVDRVLLEFQIDTSAARTGQAPPWPREFSDKGWWTPRQDAPWWYRDGKSMCFVQLDEQGSVVSLAVHFS